VTLDYDTRNNRLDPSGGVYLSGTSEFAGLGGRVFQKFLASARFYKRAFWKVVYRSNYQAGYLLNFMTDDSVPDSERFTMGGIYPHPLRGYPQGSVGTTRDVQNVRDDGASKEKVPYTIGGTELFLMNQELEFPLIPEADIRFALFFDAGNSYQHFLRFEPHYFEFLWLGY
jgi:outer membrane protein assembly factor BamA